MNMRYIDVSKIQSLSGKRYGSPVAPRTQGMFQSKIRSWKKQLRHPSTWLTLFGIVVLILLVLAALTYIVYAGSLGSKDSIVNSKNTGTIIYDRNDKVLYATAGAHDVQYVNFDKIPDTMKHAMVAIEDKDFYNHGGFSLDAIARSLLADFTSGDPTKYGASTITQQLVKNAILSNNKNIFRKYQELVLSVEVARRYSKDDILEMYLNSVYYGAGAYGVDNAAKIYFNEDASKLDLAQSAMLAAIVNAPSALSPTAGGDADAAKVRQELVLKDMASQGYITQDQANLADKEVLRYQPYTQDVGSAPHFSLWVLDLLNKQYGEDYVGRAGLRVKTTLDSDLQSAAQKIVTARVKALARNHVTNGSLVALDPVKGEVLAMVGSADYGNDPIGGKVNIAFANRQPGSSIKPVIYLKAFESRQYTAASTLHDVPTDFGGGYKPTDYDGKFRGNTPARYALAQSLNIPAVEILNGIGPSSAVEMAQRLHITTLDNAASQCGLTLVLGGCEVELYELTRAYGVMANSGTYVEPSPILEVDDRNGNKIFTPNHQTQNLVDPQYTFVMSNILSDSKAKLPTYGTGGVAALTVPGHKLAVKTGTTSNFRDAWTIGYSPNLVAGVWVGNNDGTFMDSVAGSLGAAPIWRDFMKSAETKIGWADFQEPAGIEHQQVCYGSGLKSHGTSSNIYTEVFASGTAPDQYCDSETPPPPPPTPTPQASPSAEPTPATSPGQPVATPPAQLHLIP
jgi:1A family penicillin-binding protein